MEKSHFLTRELCEQVFAAWRESFENIPKDGNDEVRALAVLNPVLTYEQVEAGIMHDPTWSSVLLWEDHVGDSDDLPAYIENARLRAFEALYHRESLSSVWESRPACLRSGRIEWVAGVYLAGISFGVSGQDEKRNAYYVASFAEDLVRNVKVAAWGQTLLAVKVRLTR